MNTFSLELRQEKPQSRIRIFLSSLLFLALGFSPSFQLTYENSIGVVFPLEWKEMFLFSSHELVLDNIKFCSTVVWQWATHFGEE